jgi:Glycosyltransferase family 28 C-terminal domain
MKAKVYLSDEGFGHIVRQRAIIEEMLKINPSLDITLQTHQHFNFAKENIKATNFIDRFNNIVWHKTINSSPDLEKMREYYDDYIGVSKAFNTIEREEKYDFIISDFVYEAFDIAESKKTPSFGVCHFTWDWFFTKLYPNPLKRSVYDYFFESANKAKILFFPPFTPSEILHHYKKTAFQVPLIVREDVNHKHWPETNGRKKIVIMDSGAGLMKDSIMKAFQDEKMRDSNFFFVTTYSFALDNCYTIPATDLLIDYVRDADLVIGRAGFNTISECLAARVPMLLISEAMNPEMEHNIIELMKERLGSFVGMKDFENNLCDFLDRFFDNEYDVLLKAIKEHQMETNGAKVIATKILDYVS